MDHAPKLHIVTGKGGVGKTSVACALALAYAQQGRRVLLAEINGGDRVADAFGTSPIGYNLREVQPRLWALDVTPEASLREYVLLTIKVQALYRAVFEGRLVSSFLRLLPALGELTMLGKIWYEYVQRDAHGRPRYDAIVLDAPATGHARALLLAPRAVMASVPTGPMRDNAERIDAMLHAATSELDIVTTAEDMPVAEAEELLSFAQEQGFHHCAVVANQVPETPSSELTRFAAHLVEQGGALQATGTCLQRRAIRAEQGQRALARLATAEVVRLPAYPWELPALALLQEMAKGVAGLARTGAPIVRSSPAGSHAKASPPLGAVPAGSGGRL